MPFKSKKKERKKHAISETQIERWKRKRAAKDHEYIGDKSTGCKKCGNPLQLSHCIGNTNYGLAGWLTIPCVNTKCGHINHVPTGKRHGKIFDVNTKLGAAIVHIGIGERQLNGLLTMLNIPVVSGSTPDARQRESGKTIETIANFSMQESNEEELRVVKEQEMFKDLSNNPKFMVKNATRFDLDQGYLGNCWFIAGASLIATQKKLFERCVPQDQGFDHNYAGIFHFNFWWYGKWVEVVIDDFLPTDGYKLIYGKNREEPDEYWAALIEKAYAKLRGCYEAIHRGKLQDALVDLTGGIAEYINLEDKSQVSDHLYEFLRRSWSMNSFFGGSISRSRTSASGETELQNGLFTAHAYSITSFVEVPYERSKVQLCRLRNPSGRGEWNGKWSDKSEEIRSLPRDTRERLGIVKRDEGEFWISFEDFIKNFDAIHLCHLHPDAVTHGVALEEKKSEWSVVTYHGQWIRGSTAGGSGKSPYEDLFWKNPQFSITLKDVNKTDSRETCALLVCLTEKEKSKKSDIFSIGFKIYEVESPLHTPLDRKTGPRRFVKDSGKPDYSRRVTRRFELPPGTYVIIPSTFQPYEEASFMLRLFTERLHPENYPTNSTKALFIKHAGKAGKLRAKELKMFLFDVSKKEFNEPLKFTTETCRILIALMDRKAFGGLEMEEAVQIWKDAIKYRTVFQHLDVDHSGYIDTIELHGLFQTFGFPNNRVVETAIVRRYGDEDKKISLTDFITVECKLTTMFQIFKEQHEKTAGDENALFSMEEFLYFTMFC